MKQRLIRLLFRFLEHPEVKTRLTKLVADIMDDTEIQKRLWRRANIRPLMPDTHWANMPNDIREERMRQATAEAAHFVSTHLAHAEGTMSALELLDQAIDAVCIDGLYLEFGVFTGSTINHIASRISHTVHGFDSFQGLPERWGSVPAGEFSHGGKPPAVRDNVKLHIGWFDQTLPKFLQGHPEAVAFLHIDSDLYSSAKAVLWGLVNQIVPGTVILFDEYFNYPHWEEHEYKAFQEFVAEFGIDYEYLNYATRGYSVAVKIKAPGSNG